MTERVLKKSKPRPLSASEQIKRFGRKYGWSYAFVLPSMLTFTIFVLMPVIWSFLISFQEYSLRSGGRWVGFAN